MHSIGHYWTILQRHPLSTLFPCGPCLPLNLKALESLNLTWMCYYYVWLVDQFLRSKGQYHQVKRSLSMWVVMPWDLWQVVMLTFCTFFLLSSLVTVFPFLPLLDSYSYCLLKTSLPIPNFISEPTPALSLTKSDQRCLSALKPETSLVIVRVFSNSFSYSYS